MEFIKNWFKNLLIMILVVAAMLIFMAIFYPKTLPIFWMVGQVYTGLNIWPIIILGMMIYLIPRRSRKSKKDASR